MMKDRSIKDFFKIVFSFEAAILSGVVSIIAGGSILLYKVEAQAAIDEEQNHKIEQIYQIQEDVKYIRGILDEMRRHK